MLEPRIYRTSLVAVVLAAIVLGFSLYDEQGSLGTTLSPQAFSGQNAYAQMMWLSSHYPSRRPGSWADQQIATELAKSLSGDGFAVSRSWFKAQTALGTRTLENVIGVRPGVASGSIVVVAHRDSLLSPSTADASGTAAMLELARDLSGETQNRTIVLASTSGSAGAAGAAQLARTIPQPVDAVIVLGDLAGAAIRDPVVVPWSTGQVVAPALLRNTVAGALAAQSGLSVGRDSFAAQFAHLAFPIAASEQSPFGAHRLPAVLLSVAGERAPAANEPVSLERITTLGRAALQSVSALDGGPSVPAPTAYVLFDGKVIPAWAIRLFVLVLILPVLLTTIDGVARARRRGHSPIRSIVLFLSAAVPFALAALVVLCLRAIGQITAAPPGPLGAWAVPRNGAATATVVIVACVLVAGLLGVLLLGRRFGSKGAGDSAFDPGAGAALMLVLCACALAIWITNPFAAALIVPALHLWMWVAAPELRLRPPLVVAMLLGGLAAPLLLVLYYALTQGLDPLETAWDGILLLAGGDVGLLCALEWSVVLGCAVGVIVIACRAVRQGRPREAPVTIRGPITYAGPGSLGGTESALRR